MIYSIGCGMVPRAECGEDQLRLHVAGLFVNLMGTLLCCSKREKEGYHL